MKSKLTLRLDDEVKERAKRLAKRRGTSVSKIVEDYFRLLLQQDMGPAEGTGERTDPSEKDSFGAEDLNTVPDDLPSRTRRMLQEIRPVDEPLDLDEDTRTWIDAAHEKHK